MITTANFYQTVRAPTQYVIPVEEISLDMEQQLYHIKTAEDPPVYLVVNAENVLDISTPIQYHIIMPQEKETDHPEILALLEEP